MCYRMHLMFTLNDEGKRIYTLKKVVDDEVSKSAHPARFSPDDKFSRYVPNGPSYSYVSTTEPALTETNAGNESLLKSAMACLLPSNVR